MRNRTSYELQECRQSVNTRKNFLNGKGIQEELPTFKKQSATKIVERKAMQGRLLKILNIKFIRINAC